MSIPPSERPPSPGSAPAVDDLDDATRWNRRYRTLDAATDAVPAAAEVLTDNAFLLPSGGRALDLACGLGGNAIALARSGLDSHAWDISSVAIERLQRLAGVHGLALNVEVRDVCAAPPPPASFDVIVVSRFLDRALMPALLAALRPRGLLFYQTFCRDRVGAASGPDNPDYLLAENELLTLCRGLTLRAYRENGTLGDHRRGLRNAAWLVGQKP